MRLRSLLTITFIATLAALTGCTSDPGTSGSTPRASVQSGPGAGDPLGTHLFARQATGQPTDVATTEEPEK